MDALGHAEPLHAWAEARGALTTMRTHMSWSGAVRTPNVRSSLIIFLLLLLTEAVYMRLDLLRGEKSLIGFDYYGLHMRRIAFAQDALFGRHSLPGWNPRELLGAPFAANLQSFPWIPTRLILI